LETISQVIEFFPYAILGSIIAGMICSFIGVFVVSQRVVFLGAALTQASIAGVAFSFLHVISFEEIITTTMGIDIPENSFLHDSEPILFSLLFALFTVVVFSQTHRQKYFTQDAVLGLVFVVAIALRIIFIQKSPVAEMAEIENILKGDILFIGSGDLYMLLFILAVIFIVFLVFQKQWKIVVFDSESADAHGVKSGYWLLLFYLIIGAGISLTTRYVGDVFTFAYLIIPSSLGILLGKNLTKVFVIAVVIGAVLPPVSLLLAFNLDLSSGPVAVATAFIIYLMVFVMKKAND
jgi:zinc transport system permease protein